MKNYFVKICLGILTMTLLSGCSLDSIILNKKQPIEKEATDKTDTADNLYISSDDSIRIYLPNENWVNSADTDKKRIFVATNQGMITIEHIKDTFAETKEVPKTKYQMQEYIENLENTVVKSENERFSFEILDWEANEYDYSMTYYCEVKILSDNQTRYEVLYGVKTEGEIYEVVGKSYVEDDLIKSEIKEAVKSVSINKKGYKGFVMEEDASQGKGKKYICIHSVNVRDQAQSSDSNVIGTLEEGEVVTVLSKEGNWYKIRFEGETGYVYKKYLEKKE